MRGCTVLIVGFLVASIKAEHICTELKGFLALRKGDTIPAPMSRVKTSDGHLSCVKNCTQLSTCRSYRFLIMEKKCILLDNQDKIIVYHPEIATSVLQEPISNENRSNNYNITDDGKGTKDDQEKAGDDRERPPDDLKRSIMIKKQHEITTVMAARGKPRHEGTSSKRCTRTGYRFLKTDYTCVKLYKDPKTWMDALQFCQSENGALLVINSGKKREDVKHVFKTQGTKRVWIGARDINDTNSFVWYDGSPMTYTAWTWHEPSHTHGGVPENCVQLVSFPSYKWNDVSCVTKCKFLCEMKPSF